MTAVSYNSKNEKCQHFKSGLSNMSLYITSLSHLLGNLSPAYLGEKILPITRDPFHFWLSLCPGGHLILLKANICSKLALLVASRNSTLLITFSLEGLKTVTVSTVYPAFEEIGLTYWSHSKNNLFYLHCFEVNFLCLFNEETLLSQSFHKGKHDIFKWKKFPEKEVHLKHSYFAPCQSGQTIWGFFTSTLTKRTIILFFFLMIIYFVDKKGLFLYFL